MMLQLKHAPKPLSRHRQECDAGHFRKSHVSVNSRSREKKG